MIPKYKKETLKESINDEDVLSSSTSLIEDKLRAIYTLFGWVHTLENFDMAQEVKEGRIAKQKHIDEVKARTAKRKGLKKLNKTK